MIYIEMREVRINGRNKLRKRRIGGNIGKEKVGRGKKSNNHRGQKYDAAKSAVVKKCSYTCRILDNSYQSATNSLMN